MASDSPILNNPYEEPLLHYETDINGNLDYYLVTSKCCIKVKIIVSLLCHP